MDTMSSARVSINQLCAKIPCSRSSLWNYRQEPDFPAPYVITKRKVLFDWDEVSAWLESKRARKADEQEEGVST